MVRILGLVRLLLLKVLYWEKLQFKNLFSVRCTWHFSLNISGAGRVVIGANVIFRDGININASGGLVSIGDNVFFNRNCSLNSKLNIDIGDGVLFGENILIYDHNHHINISSRRSEFTLGKVVVEPCAWIGAGSVLLKGTHIGHGSIVGALTKVDSVVTKNVIYCHVSQERIEDIKR